MTFYTWGEIEAARIMDRYKGFVTTKDSIRRDADYLIDLAHRIERERMDVITERRIRNADFLP